MSPMYVFPPRCVLIKNTWAYWTSPTICLPWIVFRDNKSICSIFSNGDASMTLQAHMKKLPHILIVEVGSRSGDHNDVYFRFMHRFNAYRHNFKFNVLYQTLVKIVKRRKKEKHPDQARRQEEELLEQLLFLSMCLAWLQ
jgi:hypothetical protein